MEKREHYHMIILRILISLHTKFQLELRILIFYVKFAQRRYFWSKAEKLHFFVRPWSLIPILIFSAQRSTDTTGF